MGGKRADFSCFQKCVRRRETPRMPIRQGVFFWETGSRRETRRGRRKEARREFGWGVCWRRLRTLETPDKRLGRTFLDARSSSLQTLRASFLRALRVLRRSQKTKESEWLTPCVDGAYLISIRVFLCARSRGSATLPARVPGGGTRFCASASGFSARGRFPLAVASGESVGCGGYGLGLPDSRFCGLPSAPEGRAGGGRGVPRHGGSHRIPLRRQARHPELRHLLVFVLPSPAARLTLAAP